MDNKKSIYGIKAPGCYYISDNISQKSYNSRNLENLFIDGEKPISTFSQYWFKVNAEPQKIEKLVSRPSINHRFELVEDAPGKGELPQVMPRDEVMEENDDGGCDWKPEFAHLRSLYEAKCDPQEPAMEEVDFELIILMEVDLDISNDGFSYSVQKTQRMHDGTRELTEKDVHHQQIDKIVFPAIFLPQRPSKLTSRQSYDIVRQHVKDNINSAVAEITSDYEFCFTVKKKIKLNTEQSFQREKLTPTGKSYKHKKYKAIFVRERTIEVFEMTHSEKNYGSYTILPGFSGDNQKNLKEKIDKYLHDLMEVINAPLIECENCDGMGVIC